MTKKICIACDHAGFEFKQEIVEYLKSEGYEIMDHGCPDENRVDYPDYAAKVTQDVQSGNCEKGILICGTGIGMAITANKFKGIRAASLVDKVSTEMTRKHNDLNVLCLGARIISGDLAKEIVSIFLNTEFEGGRHADRVNKIRSYE